MNYFLDVILPIPIQRLFTYRISEAEANFLKPGMRVAVPFGKSKIYTALAHNIHSISPEAYEAKEIHQILDEIPVVTQKQIELWHWIADYYMCTLGEVMRAALPSAYLLESETLVSKSDLQVDDLQLKDDEFLIYEALMHQSSLRIQEIADIIDKKNALPVINRLLDKQAVVLHEEIYEKYKPKLVRYVKLHEQYTSEHALEGLLTHLKRAPKQSQIVLSLFSLSAKTQKPIRVKDLVSESQSTSTQIKILIDKKILEEYYIQTDRLDFSNSENRASKLLNDYQENALNKVNESFNNHNVTLFNGVTSSGKTEVYAKLIEDVISKGNQVLYLVPEIALTTQLVTRLQAYFGDKIAVFHSRYSLNERVEVWNNLLKDSSKIQVVLGARSSVFLPFKKLDLIVVDEEHEQSYKQFDPAPRYHARDTAIVLASMFNAKVILGSATPSLESYFNAKQDKYGLVEITKRYHFQDRYLMLYYHNHY